MKTDQCGFAKSGHLSLVPFLSRVTTPGGRAGIENTYTLTLAQLMAQSLQHFHMQIWKIFLKWFYQGFAFKKWKVLTNCGALQKSLSINI